METPPTPKKERFPILLSSRLWRGVLIAMTAIVTAVALLYAEEDWRGKGAWEQYAQELTAKGEDLTGANCVPPPVPDDQNFAMTPLLAPLLDFLPGTQQQRNTNALAHFDPLSAINRHPIPEEWAEDKPIELIATAESLASKGAPVPSDSPQAARDILQRFEKFGPDIDELIVASHRPYSRFNVAYDRADRAGILLPHLGILKSYSALLQLRACAELELHQTDAALADVQLMLFFVDAIKTEPFLISHLVRVSCLGAALQPVWEGLRSHQWSDAQLAAIQKRLAAFDFVGEVANLESCECNYLLNAYFALMRSPEGSKFLTEIDSDKNNPPNAASAFSTLPNGWLYLEQLNCNKIYRSGIAPLSKTMVDPREVLNHTAAINHELADTNLFAVFMSHKIFAHMLVPALQNFNHTMVKAQARAGLAAAACALERYRIARGKYPAALDALAPAFLPAPPRDIILGGPLVYHATGDDQFILYSIGWNAKDDGGTVETHSREGDWVWTCP